jgi:hypothetical protein
LNFCWIYQTSMETLKQVLCSVSLFSFAAVLKAMFLDGLSFGVFSPIVATPIYAKSLILVCECYIMKLISPSYSLFSISGPNPLLSWFKTLKLEDLICGANMRY